MHILLTSCLGVTSWLHSAGSSVMPLYTCWPVLPTGSPPQRFYQGLSLQQEHLCFLIAGLLCLHFASAYQALALSH